MFSVRCLGLPRRVSPFRHPRIVAYLRLPAAFRSLSRLSSALSAKASSLRPSLLDLPFTPSVALLGGPQALAWAFPYWFGMASHASPSLVLPISFRKLDIFWLFFSSIRFSRCNHAAMASPYGCHGLGRPLPATTQQGLPAAWSLVDPAAHIPAGLAIFLCSGGHLLSHAVPSIVPSAAWALTCRASTAACSGWVRVCPPGASPPESSCSAPA